VNRGGTRMNGATILIYGTLALAVAVDYLHDRYRRD
jgi:hypothetical protein